MTITGVVKKLKHILISLADKEAKHKRQLTGDNYRTWRR